VPGTGDAVCFSKIRAAHHANLREVSAGIMLDFRRTTFSFDMVNLTVRYYSKQSESFDRTIQEA
jgi:hypothetical protein